MEIIKLSGYTENDKLKIAQKYLMPKARNRTATRSTVYLRISEMTISSAPHLETSSE